MPSKFRELYLSSIWLGFWILVNKASALVAIEPFSERYSLGEEAHKLLLHHRARIYRHQMFTWRNVTPHRTTCAERTQIRPCFDTFANLLPGVQDTHCSLFSSSPRNHHQRIR